VSVCGIGYLGFNFRAAAKTLHFAVQYILIAGLFNSYIRPLFLCIRSLTHLGIHFSKTKKL